MQLQHIYKSIDARTSIFYTWFEAMHTRIDLALCHLTEAASCTAGQEIHDEIKRIEQFSNRFDPSSTISQINREAARQPLPVSQELHTIISDCIRHNRQTAGAFDLTIQSASNYRDGMLGIVLGTARQPTIFLNNENVQLDLCGYIKGYALDRTRDILDRHGCRHALISMGNSSVLALGDHPNGDGWKIALPSRHGESIILHDECLTTSGNTAGHFHLICPATGKHTCSTRTISVVTSNGSIGEVLSTALCVCTDTQRLHIEKEFANAFRAF